MQIKGNIALVLGTIPFCLLYLCYELLFPTSHFSSALPLTLQMQAIFSPKISPNIYKATWHTFQTTAYFCRGRENLTYLTGETA
jgi:hypothetical protein